MSLGVLFKVKSPDARPGDTAQLLFSGARIPRETFCALRLADDVVREAETAAAQLREHTAGAMASLTQQAREQGYAQGHAQAMAAVLGTLEVERRLRELLSHRLADIVEHCLRGVLGELGAPQLMRQRVLHLLNRVGSNSSFCASATQDDASLDTVTLYVCPAQLSMAQAIVSELGQSTGSNIGGLTVVADKRRAPDALLLETKLGFIDSDLQLTLHEVRDMVQQALTHAMQALGTAA